MTPTQIKFASAEAQLVYHNAMADAVGAYTAATASQALIYDAARDEAERIRDASLADIKAINPTS